MIRKLLCWLGLHGWHRDKELIYCAAPKDFNCDGVSCGSCKYISSTFCIHCGKIKKE